MIIVFDPPKRLATLDSRGLDMADLDMAFFNAAVIIPSRAGRFKAIGWFRGRAILVVFASLGTEALSVISMRPASRKERRVLE